jgi:hypothetical protein
MKLECISYIFFYAIECFNQISIITLSNLMDAHTIQKEKRQLLCPPVLSKSKYDFNLTKERIMRFITYGKSMNF